MDYTQFHKFMEKVGEIEKLMLNIEKFLVNRAGNIENSLEEINGSIMRIESVVETYIERRIKDTDGT